MNHVTIKTLAKQLKLSPGTISKALRDSHEISAATKKRVLDLVHKLNYVPNPYASSLRKRKSKTIAVVLPEVADSFFSLAINGIESVAQEKGYHVLIYLTHEKFTKEQAILEDFNSGRVDGILLSISRETTNSRHIQQLQSTGVPVVLFDRVAEDVVSGKVTTDDFDSGYKATRHLLENGCRHIVFLSISNSLAISNKRMQGYKKALSEYPNQTSSVMLCSDNAAGDVKALKKLMGKKKRPDGIVVSVEKLAITAYHACQELGLNIPGDVKVIAFSNLATAFLLNPSLTTVTQPAFEMGKRAASLLFRTLEKKGDASLRETIILPSTLTIRQSTSGA